jgi:hypothetical protein
MRPGRHPWRRGFFALPMPSATIDAVADTHANPGIHSDTSTKCDPVRDAWCDIYTGTDGDARYPSSSAAAHGHPNA